MSPYKPAHWSLALKAVLASALGYLIMFIPLAIIIFVVILPLVIFAPSSAILTNIEANGSSTLAPYFIAVYLVLCFITSIAVTYFFFKDVATRRAATLPVITFALILGLVLVVTRLPGRPATYSLIDAGFIVIAHSAGLFLAERFGKERRI